jgi:hypothetical protein
MQELAQCETSIQMLKFETSQIADQLLPLETELPNTGSNLTAVKNTIPEIEDCQTLVGGAIPILENLNQEKKTVLEQFNVSACESYSSMIDPKIQMTQNLLNALTTNLTLGVTTEIVQSGSVQLYFDGNTVNTTYQLKRVVMSAEFYLVAIDNGVDLTIPGGATPASEFSFRNFSPQIFEFVGSTTEIPIYTIQSQKISITGACNCKVVGRKFEQSGNIVISVDGTLSPGDNIEIAQKIQMNTN